MEKALHTLLIFLVVGLNGSVRSFTHSKVTTRRLSTSLLDAEADCAINRRAWIVLVSSGVGWMGSTLPALGKYGESSSMEMPSYIDYLIEKNNQGNVDPEKILYKGADPGILLGRLQVANQRLNEIPDLAQDKKWSQIQGIVTGPLGTLSQTINQIATYAAGPQALAAGKRLKSTVITIGQAASQKNGPACTSTALQASKDLEEFVKIAFE